MNTRNKRASSIMVTLPFGRVFPNPDGSLANQNDRVHMALGYAGIIPAIINTIGLVCGVLTMRIPGGTMTLRSPGGALTLEVC